MKSSNFYIFLMFTMVILFNTGITKSYVILDSRFYDILINTIDNESENNEINFKYRKNSNQCNLPIELVKEIASYQNDVNRIINEIVHGKFAGDTYNSLATFTDRYGSRLVGSKNLEDAIDYMSDQFVARGLENVHTEEAPVEHWVRGYEKATMVKPRQANIQILGLGRSVGTPRGGIIAEVVAVESFDELRALPDSEVRGKIVVFVQPWVSYGVTVQYRTSGASEAAKKGAVATLIKSVAPFSVGSPHTGGNNYEPGVRQIPTACISIDDAHMILRLSRKGPVEIHLEMDDKMLPDVTSRNLIGEVLGDKRAPDESVVILSGHIDSWDVGVGAMDDGGGAFISWKALEYLKKLGFRAKRTLRAILWTGEEFGMLGAKQYEKDHKLKEKKEFNFMMESDGGTFTPQGLGVSGSVEVKCIVKEILKLMTSINATDFQDGADTPDLNFWLNRGFPGGSLKNSNEKYFWFHHSAADTMEVLNSTDLDKGTALFAAASYVIADLSIDMPKNVQD